MVVALFALLGYLSGNVLYAHVFSRLLGKEDAISNSRDGNPGTANAFMHGGFWCGTLTLLCDLLKGAVPVQLFVVYMAEHPASFAGTALVMAAPVIGHVFPICSRFQGGKGIAVTFGSLIGLLPVWQPLVMLASFFLLFTLCIRVLPHLHRTAIVYICTAAGLLLSGCPVPITAGFILLSIVVCIKLWMSRNSNEKVRVKLLWMR